MNDKISLETKDILEMITILKNNIEKSSSSISKVKERALSPLAVYLLSKSEFQIQNVDGTFLSKSDVDEITLDFTRGRTLSEEEAEIAISYIYDSSPYLSLFNTRIVDKLVTPVQGKAITQKNLISNEQNGATVAVINKRIVHNFGVNLYLKHAQLQKDIPLQTVIDNLYNAGWESEVMNDVVTSLSNDILMLALNGLGGNYASTEDFYDLNMGFNKIMQQADGKHTNTYGSVSVVGFLGRYLTPNKVDATFCTSTNYTGANFIALLRKIYKSMPKKYRDNPNNVFMMSQADLDLYVESRSDMTAPSNTYREGILNTGIAPTFMGHRLVAMPYWLSINETHESDATLYGSVIFGDPKNLDVVSDKTSYFKNVAYNARAALGPSYEYTYDMYLDFQPSRLDSFVIAFAGAKVSQPVLVSEAGAANGINGEYTLATAAYTAAGSATTKFHLCCDNEGAVMVASTQDLAGASYDTLAEALALGASAEVIPQNGYFTLSASDHIYVRAYHPYLIASECIDCNVTIS